MNKEVFLRSLAMTLGGLLLAVANPRVLVGDTDDIKTQVSRCQHLVRADEHRCVISFQDNFSGKPGQQVMLIDRNNSWVATGEIISVHRGFFVASFLGAGTQIHAGLKALVESSHLTGNANEWSGSFGKL